MISLIPALQTLDITNQRDIKSPDPIIVPAARDTMLINLTSRFSFSLLYSLLFMIKVKMSLPKFYQSFIKGEKMKGGKKERWISKKSSIFLKVKY